MKKVNIIFCGTPEFAVPTLEALEEHENVVLKSVVSMPDRPAGRGQRMASPPVALFARERGVPLVQTNNINGSPEVKSLLEAENIDAVIVLAFAQFLNDFILVTPRLGAFNIHTSLLPHYRGAAPIQYAIWNGDKITGVSIQKMVKKMDAGDVVYSHEVSIEPSDTSGSLFEKMKRECVKAIRGFVPRLAGEDWVSRKQDESQATFAPSLKKSDGFLAFGEKPSSEIANQIRAMHPWPGTYVWLNGKRLKVLEVSDARPIALKPGELSTQDGSLVVGTQTHSLRLEKVQLEGKKVCTGREVINGLQNTMDRFRLTQGACSK